MHESQEAFSRSKNNVRAEGRRLKFWGVLIWGVLPLFGAFVEAEWWIMM